MPEFQRDRPLSAERSRSAAAGAPPPAEPAAINDDARPLAAAAGC